MVVGGNVAQLESKVDVLSGCSAKLIADLAMLVDVVGLFRDKATEMVNHGQRGQGHGDGQGHGKYKDGFLQYVVKHKLASKDKLPAPSCLALHHVACLAPCHKSLVGDISPS